MMTSFIITTIIDTCLDGLYNKVEHEFIRPDLGIREGREFSCIKFVAGSELIDDDIESYLRCIDKSGEINVFYPTNAYGGDIVNVEFPFCVVAFWVKDIETFIWVQL